MEHYYFDREQACAISDMRMSVYTALEKDRTKKEIQELLNPRTAYVPSGWFRILTEAHELSCVLINLTLI